MNRPNHTLGRLGACALLLTVAGHASARGTASVYVGPSGSPWNVPANWTAGVPNGDFDAVVNDAVSDVTVFVNTLVHLNNLMIDAGDTVHIDNGREIRMHTYGGSSTIDNAGTLRLGSNPHHTYLRFDPEAPTGTFTLTGGGEIVAEITGPNWIYETGGDATLHIVDHTIRGGNLNIGYNNLEVINDALIVSDAGHTISINPPAQGDGFINNGTIRADGGTIHLDADHFDNGGGVIEALNGSVVELDNCWIHGGTIRSDDTGEVQCRSVPRLALDQTPTIEGTLRINNSRELRSFGAGTINNTGTILMDSTGSHTYFRLNRVARLCAMM